MDGVSKSKTNKNGISNGDASTSGGGVGFRKVDPDRWEFANEGFLRGQTHLLRTITRRKPAQGHTGQQSHQQSHGQSSSSVGAACVEVGKFGLEEEVERLKRDKNVLMTELVRLRQQQQTTDNQLQSMVQRLQGMEQRQQQMMSFLAKAMQSPGFLAQFVQQQNEGNNRRISEANKKRRLKQDGGNIPSVSPDGQIVKYQPGMNDGAKAILRQLMKMDTSFNNNPDNFLLSNGSPNSNPVESGSSSSHVDGAALQDVSSNAVQSNYTATQFPDISSLVGSVQDPPSVSLPNADVIMPDLIPIPDIAPESIPEESLMGSDPATGFLDPACGPMSIDLESICPDPELEAILEDSSFWDDLILQRPVPEDIEQSGSDDNKNMGNNESIVTENGWDKGQHENMDRLTEQMELLRSEHNKRV
ncbi:hypothetical protein ACFE04_032017 [Oxalis oulophora]